MRSNRHDELVEEFRGQIARGVLRPGDRLPSYAEMKAQRGLAPQTTDRIYSTLERAGLIVRAQGSGTFVAEQMAGVSAASESDNPLIVIVLPAIDHVFFSEMLSGAESACRDAGFHLLIATTGGSPHIEAQQLASLASRVVGLCIMPTETPAYGAFNSLLENAVPFVFVDRALDKLNVPLAAADNETAGYLATKHLLELGHEEIFVLNQGLPSSASERIVGYRRALAEFGIEFDPAKVKSSDQQLDVAGFNLTRELIKARKKRNRLALFCINDPMAHGAYLALKDGNWRIPHDAAVVAVGNSVESKTSSLFDPPLTTVHLDLRGMGEAGVKLLIESIKRGGRAPVRQIRLSPQLIVRNSSDPQSEYCRVHDLQKRIIAAPFAAGNAPIQPIAAA